MASGSVIIAIQDLFVIIRALIQLSRVLRPAVRGARSSPESVNRCPYGHRSRDKAAEIGANGIILSGIDEPSALTKVIGQVAKTGSQRKGKALAIYVPSDATNTATACANAKK